MSEAENILKEKQSVEITPEEVAEKQAKLAEALKQREEAALAFPPAEESHEKAKKNFRRRMTQIVQEAVDTGVNVIDIEVTHIKKAVLDEMAAALQEKGYHVEFNNRVRNGNSGRHMVVKY